MIRAILFDMDGVLVDSLKTHYFAFKTAITKFRGENISLKTFLEKFWGRYVEQNITTVFPDFPKSKLKEVMEEYQLQMETFTGYTAIYPETKCVILKLKRKKLKIGLITSTQKLVVDKILKQVRLEDCFDTIVCGDEIKRPKPATDGIIKACNFLRIKPVEAIYVGDTLQDIKAGKSAECFTVGITTTNSVKKLGGADMIIDNLSELLDSLPN